MSDLISVIVPVYNAEKYIEKCVASILRQTYHNFELLLVNDGSTDTSLDKCNRLAEKDSRITVLSRKNGGAGAARNTALKAMHGQYVVFADSDDYVSPNYLENLYQAAKVGHYDIVQCNLEKTNNISTEAPSVQFSCSDVKTITKSQALNARMYKVTVWGKIYAASIFQNFQFKEGIIYEDDASYYIFVDRAKKIAILNETLYFYFMSDNSVMRNNQKDQSTAFIQIYEDRIRYFKQRGNFELMDGSYGRFCLVLMLVFSESLLYGNNCKDRQTFLNLYKKYYSFVMKSNNISIKDKLMYTCFRICPSVVGRVIGMIRR